MAVTIKDTDKGFKKIMNSVKQIKDSYVTVGVHKDAEPYPDGASVQLVAAANEYGADIQNGFGKGIHITIPSRPFLRGTWDDKFTEMVKVIKRVHGKALDQAMSVQQAMDQIGFRFMSLVQKAIENWTTPPNAPSTQRAKANKEAMAKKGPKTEKKRKSSEAGMTKAGLNDPLVNTRHLKKSINFESNIPNE